MSFVLALSLFLLVLAAAKVLFNNWKGAWKNAPPGKSFDIFFKYIFLYITLNIV